MLFKETQTFMDNKFGYKIGYKSKCMYTDKNSFGSNEERISKILLSFSGKFAVMMELCKDETNEPGLFLINRVSVNLEINSLVLASSGLG